MTGVCKRVIYSGRVQGVGFRYVSRQLAERHGVNGFVRNLIDGRVELLAEGDAATVDAFLAAVDVAMKGRIAAQVISDAPALGSQEFVIEP
ncbi:MAG: acylphosphatase [Candidatus Acidiferrum sp.]